MCLVTLRSLFTNGSNSNTEKIINLIKLPVQASNVDESPGTYYLDVITIAKTKNYLSLC